MNGNTWSVKSLRMCIRDIRKCPMDRFRSSWFDFFIRRSWLQIINVIIDECMMNTAVEIPANVYSSFDILTPVGPFAIFAERMFLITEYLSKNLRYCNMSCCFFFYNHGYLLSLQYLSETIYSVRFGSNSK